MPLTLKQAVEKDLVVKAVIRAFVSLADKEGFPEDKPKIRAYTTSQRRATKLSQLKRIIKADPKAAGFLVWEGNAGLVSLAEGILESYCLDFETQKVAPVMDEVLERLCRELLKQVAGPFVAEIENLGDSFVTNANAFLGKPVDKRAIDTFVKSEQKRINLEIERFKKQHPWIDIEGTGYRLSICPSFTKEHRYRPDGERYGIKLKW